MLCDDATLRDVGRVDVESTPYLPAQRARRNQNSTIGSR